MLLASTIKKAWGHKHDPVC